MRSSPEIEAALKKAASSGLLKLRTENNQYLKVSYQGTGSPISPKWNVKIYTSDSLVTSDYLVIENLVAGKTLTASKDLQVLSIDDSGWGSPLGGVMVGVSDGSTVLSKVVPPPFFQGVSFTKKLYLKAYSAAGQELVKKYKATPASHRIEICTGYVNSILKEDLRILGFDVRVTEITGLLQDTLEDLFKSYIKDLVGKDLAYDPKALTACEIPALYHQAVAYGKQHCPQYLKNGWESLKTI